MVQLIQPHPQLNWTSLDWSRLSKSVWNRSGVYLWTDNFRPKSHQLDSVNGIVKESQTVACLLAAGTVLKELCCHLMESSWLYSLYFSIHSTTVQISSSLSQPLYPSLFIYVFPSSLAFLLSLYRKSYSSFMPWGRLWEPWNLGCGGALIVKHSSQITAIRDRDC